jgi:hypothetical protein
MGLESGKWGLYIHKCVVPYRSACAIEPVIRGSILRGWNVVIFLVEALIGVLDQIVPERQFQHDCSVSGGQSTWSLGGWNSGIRFLLCWSIL